MRTSTYKANDPEAYSQLKKLLKPGDTVFIVCRHVSQSGMSRRLSAFIPRPNPYTKRADIYCIDHLLANIGLFKRHSRYEGLVVGGCGMDMGFHVVYSLGRALYPKGFKLAKHQHGRNGDKTGFDNDGGYAFNRQWI